MKLLTLLLCSWLWCTCVGLVGTANDVPPWYQLLIAFIGGFLITMIFLGNKNEVK